MGTHVLTLFEHKLGGGDRLSLPPGNRVLYVADGAARLTADGAAAALGANSAWCGAAALAIDSGAGATLLRWELSRGPAAPFGRAVLAAPVTLDPAQRYLMRADRVDFPVGGVAYLHRHQGPGIRRLLHGTIRIETQGKVHDIAPGEAWFETGPDPVFAATSNAVESAFARVMILPVGLLGRSSISYVNEADKDKPKTQRYQVFIDHPISL